MQMKFTTIYDYNYVTAKLVLHAAVKQDKMISQKGFTFSVCFNQWYWICDLVPFSHFHEQPKIR